MCKFDIPFYHCLYVLYKACYEELSYFYILKAKKEMISVVST